MPVFEDYPNIYAARGADVESDAHKIFFAEPSAEWAQSFGENFQFVDRDRNLVPTRVGKFVAIRDVILVAPYPQRGVLHSVIAESRPDLKDRIETELELAKAEGMTILSDPTHPSDPVRLTDAG